MILLAVRNLVSERTRFAFSAAGIGFAVFLITVLLGLYQGWNQKVGGFVERVPADGWVARQGTTDFLNAASILPGTMGQQVAARPGVASVVPLIVRPMAFSHNGAKVETQLVGFDTAAGVGGPIAMERGSGTPSGDQIVIDTVLARTRGLGIGDTLTSGAHTFKVVGIARGGNFAFTQASFVDIRAAADLLQMGDAVTFWLFRLADGADAVQVGAGIENGAPGVQVFTSHAFAQATRHRILDSVVPIIGLIVGLAFVVGIAITSLTIYTATVERTREFGVMKAIGFNNQDLYRLVVSQSMLTGTVGFVFGVALTLVLSRFVDRLVPQFIVYVRAQDVALVLLATVLMAAGAAIVPARRVGAVDPAVAFKG